jgi:hypothetical protein
VATNNTVQYTITAKDQASAVFAQVAQKAKGTGAAMAESFAMVGAAAFAMRGTVKDGLGVLSGDFTKLGSLLGALPGPIGVVGQAVGDTMGRILDSTIKAADGYRKLSEKTGASIEFLSRFTEAADDVFISSESVNSALNIFAKKIGGVEDAMDGSGVSAGAFAAKLREIGVTSDNMEEALLQVADRFKEMPNGTDKAALAVQLFGKQGAELIPILNKGRDDAPFRPEKLDGVLLISLPELGRDELHDRPERDREGFRPGVGHVLELGQHLEQVLEGPDVVVGHVLIHSSQLRTSALNSSRVIPFAPITDFRALMNAWPCRLFGPRTSCSAQKTRRAGMSSSITRVRHLRYSGMLIPRFVNPITPPYPSSVCPRGAYTGPSCAARTS